MPRPPRSSSRKDTGTGRTRSRIARKDIVHKFDEKVVGETDRTVPVAPVKQSRKARQPIPEPALDHRRQIVWTDEPKGSSRQ